MSGSTKPIILVEGNYSHGDLESLKKRPLWQINDIFKQQLAELFEISNPKLRQAADYEQLKSDFIHKNCGDNPDLKGNWVYLPWSGHLIHLVKEEDYYRLRTNRNQNLIKGTEQEKLKNAKVGVAGLSVGNAMAISLAYSGVSTFHLSDYDNIETANLNRLRSGIHMLGKPKLEVTSQQIYEINPYAHIKTWAKGLDSRSLNEFCSGLTAVFDELDDFSIKVELRKTAKNLGTPLMMLTALGDSILIDIERYDLNPDTELFNGLLGTLPEEILSQPISERQKIKYALEIVGIDNVPTRAVESLLEINHSLVGRPQLYSTIAIEGGLAAYLVRKLVLGEELPSRRLRISLPEALNLTSKEDLDRPKLISRIREILQ